MRPDVNMRLSVFAIHWRSKHSGMRQLIGVIWQTKSDRYCSIAIAKRGMVAFLRHRLRHGREASLREGAVLYRQVAHHHAGSRLLAQPNSLSQVVRRGRNLSVGEVAERRGRNNTFQFL